MPSGRNSTTARTMSIPTPIAPFANGVTMSSRA
jgi:hypothetical protein